MRAVLVGYGEIGKAVTEVFGQVHEIVPHDPAQGLEAEGTDYDLMLVAVGYTHAFRAQVTNYQERFGVTETLIFSTVPIGTCRALNACHFPIEGKHPELAESLRHWDGYMGGFDTICAQFVIEAGFAPMLLQPEHVEFLKLRSTTLYGVNIEFARYTKRVCDELGLDYQFVKDWDNDVNRLYSELKMPEYTRYILDPPAGPKGGHCVTPNARILDTQFPNPLVTEVAEWPQ